jgi:hypothetical protein
MKYTAEMGSGVMIHTQHSKVDAGRDSQTAWISHKPTLMCCKNKGSGPKNTLGINFFDTLSSTTFIRNCFRELRESTFA